MGVSITNHAIDKYISITGCANRRRAVRRLRKMFSKSERVFLDPEIAGQRIMRASHRNGGGDIRPVEYYEFDVYRFIVVDGTIITFELKFKEDRKNGKR